LVFLASLTSEKVITLIDLREGYSQSYHGSKQQRVANFAYLSKIAISNLM